MSFIYACKLTKPYSIGETIEIHSDTKILFNEIEEKSFDSETLNYIKKYGIVKCIIVDSQCCIAFAGNNIKLVHDLLDNYYNTTSTITISILSQKLISIIYLMIILISV